MQSQSLPRSALLLALCVGAGCNPDTPTSSDSTELAVSRTSATGPTVSATDPDTGFRSTTIDVQVLGSGFDQGSGAIWALNGDTSFATTRIKTNRTTYLSPKKLLANITIGADAPFDLYDVVVLTSGGKKGIGIELFAVTYVVVDLGTLGGTNSEAYGLNYLGQVVGWSETLNGERHAFLWSQAAGMRDLGALGSNPQVGVRAEARDINDAGVVVGQSSAPSAVNRGFRWTEGGGMQDIGTLGGPGAAALAIGPTGDIGGWSYRTDIWHGFPSLWIDGGVLDLGRTDVWMGGQVSAVNGVGQVVGYMGFSDSTVAVVWTRGSSGWTPQTIATPLGGGPREAQAYGINDLGQVVGMYRQSSGVPVGFVWSPGGGIATLPPLAPGARSQGDDVNGSGQIAGFGQDNSNFWRPVIWTQALDGSWTPQRLPVLYQGDAEARAINTRGELAGFSQAKRTSRHAVLWRLQ
jgi:probable HAF family extracellular repeat protein